MNYDDLSKLLQFNEKESKLYIPNEIFKDIQIKLTYYANENKSKEENETEYIMVNGKQRKKRGKNIGASTNHIALAYSYTYLVTWLYRYTKYANIIETIDQKRIKSILGYNPTDKRIDYLIKENGLLEQWQWLKTTTDYPVSWEYSVGDYSVSDTEELTFELLSDRKKDEYLYKYSLSRGKNFKVKYPVRSFTRYPTNEEYIEDYSNGYIDGAFYEVDNTHLVPFEVFMYSMTNKDVGCIGFYLWSYLKSKCQKFGGYDVSVDRLAGETGIKASTLDKYLAALKKYRMIDFTHNQEYFVLGMKKEDRKANTYITNEDVDFFTDKPIKVEKIKIMKRKEYIAKVKKEEELAFNTRVKISVDELPY